MTVGIETHRSLSDYSLVGEHAALAVERGLADAKWYASPIPKEKMRELLERRDGPAVRDTLLWFALLLAFGLAGLALWGTWWAIIPFAIYGQLYASSADSRWHECRPRHRVQDRLDEQRALRDRVVHGLPPIGPVALEPRPPPQRYDHRRTRPGDRGAATGLAERPPAEDHQHSVSLQLLPQPADPRHRQDDTRRAEIYPGIGVRQGLPAGAHLPGDLPGGAGDRRSPRAASCRCCSSACPTCTAPCCRWSTASSSTPGWRRTSWITV